MHISLSSSETLVDLYIYNRSCKIANGATIELCAPSLLIISVIMISEYVGEVVLLLL